MKTRVVKGIYSIQLKLLLTFWYFCDCLKQTFLNCGKKAEKQKIKQRKEETTKKETKGQENEGN